MADTTGTGQAATARHRLLVAPGQQGGGVPAAPGQDDTSTSGRLDNRRRASMMLSAAPGPLTVVSST